MFVHVTKFVQYRNPNMTIKIRSRFPREGMILKENCGGEIA